MIIQKSGLETAGPREFSFPADITVVPIEDLPIEDLVSTGTNCT